jgi:hypothetical protein
MHAEDALHQDDPATHTYTHTLQTLSTLPALRARQVFNGDANPARPLGINSGAMRVETDIFSGRVEIHLKGLKTTQQGMFQGKKRFFQIACQVRGHVAG